MALSHLNNEAPGADGLLQSFWSQNDRGSRSSSPHEAALSDVGSTTSLNDALREASVNSHSSASFDLASSGDKSAPVPATQDTEFVVPNKPASFKVGPGPRLTSTGKVSHARKVPVNHIKRSVTATQAETQANVLHQTQKRFHLVPKSCLCESAGAN